MKNWLSLLLIVSPLALSQDQMDYNKCETDATYVYQQDYVINLNELKLVSQAIHHKDASDITDAAVEKFQNEMKLVEAEMKLHETNIKNKMTSLGKLDKSFDARSKSIQLINSEETKLLKKLNATRDEAARKYQAFTTQYKHQLSDDYFLWTLKQNPKLTCKTMALKLEAFQQKIDETENQFSTLRRSFFRK